MTTILHKIKTPPLWAKCLLGSIALHSTVVYILMNHSIIPRKTWGTLFSPSKPIPKHINADQNWQPETLVLQHFFEEFPSQTKKIEIPSRIAISELIPLPEANQEISVELPAAFFLKEKIQPSSEKSISFPLVSSLDEEVPGLIKTDISFMPLPKASYAEPLFHEVFFEKKSKTPSIQIDSLPRNQTLSPSQENLPRSFTSSKEVFLENTQTFFPIRPFESFYQNKETSTIAAIEPSSIGTIPQEISFERLASASFSDINEYLPEELVAAIEWNEDFEIKASLFPEKDGYVFSLALTPKQDLRQQKIHQNFYFLIDVSSDIENHKLSVFKKAALKAISSLERGDSFNIFLLDKKIEKLSSKNLQISPETIAIAEDFLEKKSRENSFFSSLNLSQNLNEILNFIENDDEVHTGILFSNGKASLEPKELRQFVDKNQGKLSLFTAAVGQNNHLTFLDMISSFCGGSLFYSDTNASFPRKLSVFIKALEAPLAKNLSFSIYASNPKAELELTPVSQMPNLYNKEPFVIMGKINRLCDLHFVLQGKSAEDQIFLKKVIHFEEASSPENATKKEWLVHQKSALYEKFLKESKPSYLKGAKDILKILHGKAFGE